MIGTDLESATPGGSSTDAAARDQPVLDLPDRGLLGALVRVGLAVTGVLEEHAGRSGLTFADYLVLGVVRRSPDQRSAPTAIATTLGRTTGGMSLTLDRLESAGLVVRRRHPDDGRRVVVELTTSGRRLAASVNAALHEWEAALELPVPVATVVELLDDLTAAIESTDR